VVAWFRADAEMDADQTARLPRASDDDTAVHAADESIAPTCAPSWRSARTLRQTKTSAKDYAPPKA
jgi:hypothetical protein